MAGNTKFDITKAVLKPLEHAFSVIFGILKDSFSVIPIWYVYVLIIGAIIITIYWIWYNFYR